LLLIRYNKIKTLFLLNLNGLKGEYLVEKIEVKVYGGKNLNGGGCGGCCIGCGATNQNVEEEYSRMVDYLSKEFEKGQVNFSYIDTEGHELSEYPLIEKVIMNGYSFPVTVINDTPYLAGAIDAQAVSEIIQDIIKEEAEKQ